MANRCLKRRKMPCKVLSSIRLRVEVGCTMDRQDKFLGYFLQHQRELRAVIGSMVRDRVACDDIFQEVALVLWRKFDQYDETRPFGAWARGIAVKKIMQSFDRNRRQPTSLDPSIIESVVDCWDEYAEQDAWEESVLRRCIQKLPERSRRLVKLRYEDGLTLQGVADQLSSTLQAAHKALSRIRIGLKRCVEQEMAAEG